MPLAVYGHFERCLSDNMYYGTSHVNDINGLACSITLYPPCDMDLACPGPSKPQGTAILVRVSVFHRINA